MPRFKFNLEERSRFEKVLAIDKQATLPKLEVQVLDGSDPVDLTGATVTFSMQDSNGVAKISGAAATLDDAAKGKISYAFQGADVDTDGVFSGQFSVVVAGGTYKIPNASTQRLIIQIGRVELAGLPTADGLVALHAALHLLGALDEVDADQLGIDISLPNITPDTGPAEVSSTKHLGAILKGISDSLASLGGGGAYPNLNHISGLEYGSAGRSATASLSANTMSGIIVEVPNAGDYDRGTIYGSVFPTAAMGVYNVDSNLLPTTLLKDWGVVSTVLNLGKSTPVSAVTLPAGLVYLFMHTSGGGTLQASGGLSDSSEPVLPLGQLNTLVGVALTGVNISVPYTGVMPADLSIFTLIRSSTSIVQTMRRV